MQSPNPVERPSRIPCWGQFIVATALLLSLVSGIAIWYGQSVQAEELSSPPWMRGALILHGGLNPVQCALFGVLVGQHIRIGWQMRANLLSGFLMEGVFLGLILTGLGLYYAAADWRERMVLLHRILGLAMPAALGIHWISGLFWAKRALQSQPVPPAGVTSHRQ
jgi:hypothetical protein